MLCGFAPFLHSQTVWGTKHDLISQSRGQIQASLCCYFILLDIEKDSCPFWCLTQVLPNFSSCWKIANFVHHQCFLYQHELTLQLEIWSSRMHLTPCCLLSLNGRLSHWKYFCKSKRVKYTELKNWGPWPLIMIKGKATISFTIERRRALFVASIHS